MNIFKKEDRLNKSAEVIYDEKDNEELETGDIEEEDNLDEPDKLPNFKEQEKKPSNKPINIDTKEELFFRLSELVRTLADAEIQLKTKKIWWKSDKNMTGLMTINEVISLATALKFDIKRIGDILINEFEVEDESLNNKIKEYAEDLNTYDYWLK